MSSPLYVEEMDLEDDSELKEPVVKRVVTIDPLTGKEVITYKRTKRYKAAPKVVVVRRSHAS